MSVLDSSRVSISVSGDSNDMNVIINSNSATVSEGERPINGIDGINGADGADGADGVDGADGADGADGLDTERYVQANNYKYTVPHSVLTSSVDPSSGLTFYPCPKMTWDVPGTVGEVLTHNDYFRGMLLPTHSPNCGGTWKIALAMYGFFEISGMSVFNNGTSILNDVSLQKLYGLHLSTLQDEVDLGWNYAKVPPMPTSWAALMANDPSAQAMVQSSPLFNDLSWNQAKVDARFTALNDLSGVANLVTWDSQYINLFEYFEYLELIHINTLLRLSGVNTSTIIWGDASFTSVFGAADYSYKSEMKGYNTFGAVGAAVAANIPYVPTLPVSLERLQLAEFTKKQVPQNVLFDLLSASEHMTFSPTPVMTYNVSASVGEIGIHNEYFRDMLLPTYSYNCGGTWKIALAMYGLFDVSGMPVFKDGKSLLNNSDVQKIYGLHLSTLKNEVDLGWDYAAKPAISSTLTSSSPAIVNNASKIILANPDLSWNQARVTVRFNALQDLSGIANLVTWDSAYVNLFEYFEFLELIHINTLLKLSSVNTSTITWGDVSFNTVFVESDPTFGYKGGKGLDTFMAVGAEVAANMPYVPKNALSVLGSI